MQELCRQFFTRVWICSQSFCIHKSKKCTNKSWIVGLICGFCNGACDLPIFVVKTRVQCSNEKFQETLPSYWRMSKHL
eukprot:UN18701